MIVEKLDNSCLLLKRASFSHHQEYDNNTVTVNTDTDTDTDNVTVNIVTDEPCESQTNDDT